MEFKKFSLIVSAAVIIALAVGIFFIVRQEKKEAPFPETKPGIEVFSPKANEEITSPLEIKGIVNGGVWIGFEGQVGTVKLLDSQGSELANTYLRAATDWMKPPIIFEATLDFVYPNEDDGKLVFSNENPSGLPQYQKEFVLPVKITKTVRGAVQVKIYFNNNSVEPQYACQEVLPVDRGVDETKAVARAALEELLKGPTNQEILEGFFTSINPDVKIQKLTIENGVAKVDFDGNLEKNVGGSCRVAAIRNQITQTLLQFKTIKSVIISINGRTEDILQP